MTTMQTYRFLLATRFRGVLAAGSHEPDSVACALEVASVARGKSWSDSPTSAGLPDLRRLNDARWSSDAMRTAALLPVIEAYWDWPTWSHGRRAAILQRVAEGTIRRVVPIMLRAVGLDAEAERCEREGTPAARAAADAARAAAAAAAAAADDAAAAADDADAADHVLRRACEVWIQAVAKP